MREPVVGIDLGTTYSAVATVEEGKPQVIPNRGGHRLTPSMIGFLRSGERVVGELAQKLIEEVPDGVAFATKRFIGRRFTPELAAEARSVVPYTLVPGPSGEVRVKLGSRILPLPQISAMVLGELKLDAQAYFGRPVSKAVITVPANFDDSQRQATKEAALIAGLEVLRIVNEPTAAAVAYGLTQGFQGRALVFDLGGGTFDVSILEVENGVFQVKATGGDPQLGGEDFDNRIVEWLLAQVGDGLRSAVTQDKLSLQRLKIAAERAKRELTSASEASISVADLGDHMTVGNKDFAQLETALTREFFESLCEPLSRRCLAVCERVMSDAKLDPTAVDAVLMVGGMTRVPLVRRLVADFFGRAPITRLNPDEVVALGAAVHANEVAAQSGQALLIDVVSHSLGVGVLGGKVRQVIQKNTAIPVVAKEVFLPGQVGQRGARIPVYQGENERCDENTKLGELYLKDLSVADRAETPIEVTFEISSEGTVSVRATDLTTGLAEAIRIEARTELSQGEVEQLRKEQVRYSSNREVKDTAALEESFKKLLDKGEKLAQFLQQSAEENPSGSATAAVQSVKSLLELGRVALKSKNSEQITEVSKRLAKLTAGR